MTAVRLTKPQTQTFLHRLSLKRSQTLFTGWKEVKWRSGFFCPPASSDPFLWLLEGRRRRCRRTGGSELFEMRTAVLPYLNLSGRRRRWTNGSDECCLPQRRPLILSGSANKNQQQGVYKRGRNPVSSICNEISALNPDQNFEKKKQNLQTRKQLNKYFCLQWFINDKLCFLSALPLCQPK